MFPFWRRNLAAPFINKDNHENDTQLQSDVLAELKWDPSVQAAHIGVEAKDGVITLAGHTTSFGEKWHAEKAAQRVAGVKAIVVELDVKIPGTMKRNDGDIGLSVSNALAWQIFIPLDAIKVMIEHGFVTLSGSVAWEHQRQAAFDAVRYIAGVTGVSNQIAIEPLVSLDAVKADIVAAIERQTHGHAKNIAVEIQGADIFLSGRVPDWHERSLAKKTAWSTPGVRAVIDNMTLA